jgi:hypothetical protein
MHHATGSHVRGVSPQRRQHVRRSGSAVQERRQAGPADEFELALEASQLHLPLTELQPEPRRAGQPAGQRKNHASMAVSAQAASKLAGRDVGGRPVIVKSKLSHRDHLHVTLRSHHASSMKASLSLFYRPAVFWLTCRAACKIAEEARPGDARLAVALAVFQDARQLRHVPVRPSWVQLELVAARRMHSDRAEQTVCDAAEESPRMTIIEPAVRPSAKFSAEASVLT